MAHFAFHNIVLYGKRHREPQTVAALLAVKALLEKHGLQVFIEEQTAAQDGVAGTTVAEEAFGRTGDLMVVVGGDGSLLAGARAAAGCGLPVVGIHRGRLGFLTDIPPDALEEMLLPILKGQYQEEKRFLLQADIYRDKKMIATQTALNDVVLLPGDIAHMIEFSIEINQQFMCLQRADGMIVATPTGSTAYALSGGGPILHPELEAVALVPMFPHKLTSRPIVIGANSVIDIHMQSMAWVSCDGHDRLKLEPFDVLRIFRAPQTLRLIHPLSYQYFATLRRKLQWENRPQDAKGE